MADDPESGGRELAALYRAATGERTPRKVDTAVLAMARREAAAANRRWTAILRLSPVSRAAAAIAAISFVAWLAVPRGIPDSTIESPATRSPFEAAGGTAEALYNDAASRAADALQDVPPPAGSVQEDASSGPAICSAGARATPAAWEACIRKLDASGQPAAAETERKAMLAAFPETDAARTPGTGNRP